MLPNRIKHLFYYYNGKKTGIDSLINIEGYYKMGFLNYKERDIYFKNFMFYQDGIFVFDFFDHNNNIPKYFRNIVEKNDKSFYRYFFCGHYIISADTIKTQCINHPAPSLETDRLVYEIWFKVIDKNTLQCIYYKQLYRNYEKYPKNSMETKNSLHANFIPIELRPNSDCWLKKKKWFWCDKEKWKEYMKHP